MEEERKKDDEMSAICLLVFFFLPRPLSSNVSTSSSSSKPPPSFLKNKNKTGCVAGAMVSVCMQPLDVLRTRMQADAAAGRLQSTVRTLRAVLESQGAK